MAIFNSYVKLPEGSVCGLLTPLLCLPGIEANSWHPRSFWLLANDTWAVGVVGVSLDKKRSVIPIREVQFVNHTIPDHVLFLYWNVFKFHKMRLFCYSPVETFMYPLGPFILQLRVSRFLAQLGQGDLTAMWREICCGRIPTLLVWNVLLMIHPPSWDSLPWSIDCCFKTTGSTGVLIWKPIYPSVIGPAIKNQLNNLFKTY